MMRAHDEGREGELWRRHRRPYPIWPTLILSTLIWSGKPDAIFTCVASHVLLHGCCEVTKPIAGGQTLMQMPPDCAPPQITTVVACEQGSVTRHAQSQDMLSHKTCSVTRHAQSRYRHSGWRHYQPVVIVRSSARGVGRSVCRTSLKAGL